jgi:hypothetical protein
MALHFFRSGVWFTMNESARSLFGLYSNCMGMEPDDLNSRMHRKSLYFGAGPDESGSGRNRTSLFKVSIAAMNLADRITNSACSY